MAATVILLGPIWTASEFAPISSFKVELNTYALARIIQLSDSVKKAQAYEIQAFDGSVAWYSNMLDDHEDELGNLDINCINNFSEESTEVDMLHVTKDQLYWSAVPKHGSDADEVRTVAIPIDKLTDLFKETGPTVTHYFEE